jgi:hypothetical protein
MDAKEIAYVQTVLDALAEALVRFGRPMPPTVIRARGILDRALTCAVSPRGQDLGDDAAESLQDNLIGSREAAKLLGCTRRTIARNGAALGGRRVSGTGDWVFNKTSIAEKEY